MKNMYKHSLAAAVASLVLVNCGGVEDIFDPGDDDSDYVQRSYTGQFVDTYVKGLNYTCTSKVYSDDGEETGETRISSSGVTNNKGEFTCNEGDVVEFSIGNYVIGSTYAYGDKTIKSPYDLGLGGTEAVINVAQLLQTIDDKSIDGVLTIPNNFTALDGVTTTVSDPDFDALMADALNVEALVSEEDAKAHLNESIGAVTPAPIEAYIPITSEMLDGKTFYERKGADCIGGEGYAKMSFSNGTSTRTELEQCPGESDTGGTFSFTYNLDNGFINAETAGKTFKLKEQNNELWVLDEDDTGWDYTGEETWHLSKPLDFPASL